MGLKRGIICSAIFITCLLHGSDRFRHLFDNKSILITGGAGFLGRALTREILKYDPAKIVIFSRDEVKHFNFLEELKDRRVVGVLGDVRQYDSLKSAMKGIDIVIHAAALKRIDMIEHNVVEVIRTNVIGSYNVIRAAEEAGVRYALLVSTDKSCSPVNAYGASKFLAEKIVAHFCAKDSPTRLLAVRYGNVLESTGSIIPFFCNKIKENKPIPLTDSAMTRFLINKDQAVELIFKALLFGQGGEIFVPRLPSAKIIDLIAVLQAQLDNVTPVKVVGIRPGEKIDEIMINHAEIPRTYICEDMYVIMPSTTFRPTSNRYKDFDKTGFTEYSSGDNPISRTELNELLRNYFTNK